MSDVINLKDHRAKKTAVFEEEKRGPIIDKSVSQSLLPARPRPFTPDSTPTKHRESVSNRTRQATPISLGSTISIGLPILESELFELEKALAIVKKGSDNSSKAIQKIQNAIQVLRTFCSALRSAQ